MPVYERKSIKQYITGGCKALLCFSHFFDAEATPALGLSLSYEMRESFVEFKFCKTSLKLCNLMYVSPKKKSDIV